MGKNVLYTIEKVGKIVQSIHLRDISHKGQESKGLCHQVRSAYDTWRMINSPPLLDHWVLAARGSPQTETYSCTDLAVGCLWFFQRHIIPG